MSLILRKDDIVDRVKEAQTIESIIRETARSGGTQAIVLWADTGYGKSSIMRKVQSFFDGQPIQVAIVETPPTNCATPIDGQYLNYIAETINRVLSEQLPLRQFLLSFRNEITPLLDAESILHNGLSLKSGALLKIGETALADLTEQRLFFDTTIDSILLIKNYIETALQTTHIVLDITNAQNMDATSFRVLNNILERQRDLTMVFEYTTQGGRTVQLERFVSQLSCPYTEIEIDVLPFDFALTIFGQPENPNAIYEIEKFYRNVVKGNLYKIIQAKSSRSLHLNADPIEVQIKDLSYASKLLLSVLCLLGGKSTEEEFQHIRNHIEQSFFIPKGWAEELSSFIEVENKCIALRHASIADTLQLGPDNATALAAYKYLSEYYSSMVRTHESYADYVQIVPKLAVLHSQFDPSKLALIINRFKEVIIEKFDKNEATQLVEQAFDALGQMCETEFHFMLIALCYEAGFYDSALELLQKLDPLVSECGYTFYCMLLNRNDLHKLAVETCQKAKKVVKNPRYQLIIQMTQMLSERSLGLPEQCRKTCQGIERTAAFHDLLEYGFFLRNKQIVLSYEESLPYIEKSIAFFDQRNQKLYAAHSRLTHLVQRARLGHPQESEEELEKIAPVLLHSSFERHIVYLNHASLRLLQGIADQKTLHLLDKAYMTVTTTFDRAVVLNNKLCALIIQGNSQSNEFRPLMAELVRVTEDEPDANLRRKVFANIALYYKMAKDHANYEHWVTRVKQIKRKTIVHPFEDILLFGAPPAKDFRFLATRPCCVFFITYWHFDIPIIGL